VYNELARKAYVVVLLGLSIWMGWQLYAWGTFAEVNIGIVAAFVILTLAAEALPVRLPRGTGTVSVGFALIYASVLLFGAGVGFVMGALGTIDRNELGKIPLTSVLFNRAQLALAAGSSGLVFTALGGEPGHFGSASVIIPMFLGGGTYFLVNIILVSLFVAMKKEQSPWQIWIMNLQWVTPHYLALMPLAFLIAVSYRTLGMFGLVAFFLPLLVARYSFQRFMDMRETFLDTITSLAKALEAKDPHTKGHADRVSKVAVELARQLDWSEQDVELIEYVGLLHDIGKIGIEDSVLKKPGKFTEDEYVQMKEHARIGARILDGIKLLGKGAQWVEHHHEWYNGRGYPDGLKGEEIPLGARILAVADAFDAMISDRPYKQSCTIEEAREELRRFAGTQFDPEVVEAFLEISTRPDFLDTMEESPGEVQTGEAL
jgi:putative nucleotidyltransferase with HDIG domain